MKFYTKNGQETVQVGFGRTTPYNRTFMIFRTGWRSLGPPSPISSCFHFFSRFLFLPPTDLIKIINEITLKLARAQAPGDDTLFAQSRVNNFLLVESMLMAIEAASVFLLLC